MTQPDGTVKLSEATKRSGVSVEILRRLAEDRLLPGTVRSARGHVYLRADAVPTFDQIEAVLVEQIQARTAAARKSFARVQVELEAVGNDLAELDDDPWAPVGDDLRAFRHRTSRDHTTLTSALSRLEEHVWALWFYKEFLEGLTPRSSWVSPAN